MIHLYDKTKAQEVSKLCTHDLKKVACGQSDTKEQEINMTMTRIGRFLISALMGLIFVFSAQAITRIWDGGGDGRNWTDTLNWNPDGATGNADFLTVGSSASVTNGQITFSSLEIQTNASVTLAGDLTSGRTLSVAGTLNKVGVFRLNGATINLSGHLGSGITWLDMNGGSISFTNGAAFDNAGMSFEHKGNNTFGFKLSAGGFKTVTAGYLYSGNNGFFNAAWSNVTYNVDISDYDLRCGLRVVLMDFTGNGTVFNSGFNTAKVNIFAGSSGLNANLSFDTSTSSLVLTFPYPLTWSGGGDGANWMDRLNWMPTNLPSVSDTVVIGSSATVTNGQSTFATLEIQTNATVRLSAKTGQDSIGARTLTVAGTLDVHAGQGGVLRLGGTTINLSGHLGSGIGWLDLLNGTINFTKGAAFDNSGMSFEHKGNNTFRYTLSTNGFTTLVAGRLWSGSSGGYAAWSNATYTVDISAYDRSRGNTIVLADYNGHDNIFTNTFNPKVTVTGQYGGSLRFDTTTSSLVLKVNGPKGTLIRVQ